MTNKPTIQDCMEQAQVFASTWSLVGKGAFGTTLEQATAEEGELESMLRAAFAAPAPVVPSAIAFSLQWPDDVAKNRINISTTFDTEEEAKGYVATRLASDYVRVVALTLAAPAQAAAPGGPSESLSDVQRQAFIKGWDHRGMAHQLKGSVETDDRMRVLMGVFYPRVDAATVPAAPAQADELEATAQAAPVDAAVQQDAERYRIVRRGQRWSVIDGIGNELRAEALDESVDAARAAQDGK